MYYEQDMANFVIFFDYHNNVYQRWYENWQNMFVIRKEDERLKEILTIEKEKLQQHNNYGWSFVEYLHTPRNTPKLDKWNCDKFKSMPKKKN